MCAWVGFERSSNPANRPISFRFSLRLVRSELLDASSMSTHEEKRRGEKEREREKTWTSLLRPVLARGHVDEPFGFPVGWIGDIFIERYSNIRRSASMEEKRWFPFPLSFLCLSCVTRVHTGGSTVWLSLMSSNGRLFCWTKSWKIL